MQKNQKDLDEKISRHKPANVSLEEFKKTTLAVTPDECIEQLQVYVNWVLPTLCFILQIFQALWA